MVIFSDKSVYVGELENELPNGYGVWTHPNGEEYKGQWSDGKENGPGVYSYPDGGEFSGNFVDGLREGSGIWSHPDGSVSYTHLRAHETPEHLGCGLGV